MITPMKKFTFLVFHHDYEAFLSELREAGVVHVTQRAAGLADDADLQALIARRAEIKHLLQQGCTDQALQEKSNIEQQIRSTQKEQARVAVWGDFSSKTISQLQEAGYTLYYYSCPKAKFEEEWGVVVAEANKNVYFVTVGTQLENDAVTALQLTKSAAELQRDLDALNGLLAAANAKIEAWSLANKEQLESELKDIEQQIDWKQVTLNTESAAEGALCVLEGFCPEENAPALEKRLNALSAALYYEVEDPKPEDATPIKLHNNWFAKLFEPLTGMYGWPSYGEFDPTPILAPFYLLFFAMCMGDAGYGILLIIFGLLIHYNKLKISMFEGLGPIISALGAGTLVVGFFLGTAFGMDLSALFPSIDYLFLNGKVVTEGGVQYLTKAAYAASGIEGGYDVAMVLALFIGVFHICLAMVVKALCYTKRFGFRAQLGTWGWTLLIVGGIAAFVICLALSVPMNITKIVLITIACVSALGIYVFNTPGRNPLVNIGAGLWDTYNMATGILGDTLSYIRLYALGLAGGMLGGAFNNLGLMVMGGSTTGTTWQWLPFILILLVGHLLNLAMSALGAFVHPLRLTFVEYFKNSGYEGKGNKYSPFKK
ncbi:MAG: ATPase V [Paludibacteraceae bacterium]|nr:ATPase V [Paludibacteraceae bacterium]